MRILCGITIVAILAVVVWWTFPLHAEQKFNAISMNPGVMMKSTTGLPTDPQYDQGTVFLPEGVHYN